MEFNHRPFLLHGLLLVFFVSTFLVYSGEELVEFFFLLDLPVFILCSSKGLIILCKGFDCTNGQADDGTYIGASLLGFVLPFLLFWIVGILLRQPPKSRHSPDTSPDSTAEDATVISMDRRFSFFCLLYSS